MELNEKAYHYMIIMRDLEEKKKLKDSFGGLISAYQISNEVAESYKKLDLEINGSGQLFADGFMETLNKCGGADEIVACANEWVKFLTSNPSESHE